MNTQKYTRDGRAPVPAKEVTSKIMSSIKDRNTSPELILRKELWKLKMRGYRLHMKKIPGRPDVCYPSKKLAVFVNGCYWHRCPYCNLPVPKTNTDFWANKFSKNKARDERKIMELNKIGWRTVVIWECQIRGNVDQCCDMIKNVIIED